ncbi:MAG: KUP/HAK/KT family potassium transporter [Polyangiaceae bacterium]
MSSTTSPVSESPSPAAETPPPSTAAAAEPPKSRALAQSHGHHPQASTISLALAAMGVVYGDIGTSPLYAIKECVDGAHGVHATHTNVLGILSLIVWGIVFVVCIKYLTFITRANNQGEGGILALLALVPESKKQTAGKIGGLTALILFGSSLLYGDGIITPAISVLSAVEGLEVATASLKPLVLPITVGVIVGLFAVQRRGTATIGRVFGPIVLLWFATIGTLGLLAVLKHPVVLGAINPLYAVEFFIHNKVKGFIVLGSVFLCITGGEALYADMGHFGRKPIMLAWYTIAMPALLLNYFGQGALLLNATGDELERIAANPFYAMVPAGPAIYPLVAIAATATVIASQAMISGAFSLTRQAVQLGFLPRVTIKHTSSDTEGQIYIPEVNWALAAGCVALVLTFKESSKLAAAYGIAVTGTMGITSLAFYKVARTRWNWPFHKIGPLVGFFLVIDGAFLAANLIKLFDGGFVPVLVGLAIFLCMRTWKRGRALLARFFAKAARPLDEFLAGVGRKVYVSRGNDDAKNEVVEEVPLVRIPGVAVFLTSSGSGTPPLLLHHARHNKAIHDTVLLVTVTTDPVPRVQGERVRVEPLGHGFHRITIHVGFMETPNVPSSLAEAIELYDLKVNMNDVTYYLGRETLLATSNGEMSAREEQLFAFLTKNSQNATRYFGIPPARVVEIGMQVDL